MTILKEKLAILLTQLNHGLVDRDATLKSALLSILAGENILLIGPPGTAKSLIARRIAQSFAQDYQTNGNTYFEYLLTKFSTPEEIFGPLSITELKADRFKRNTAGYLPAVKVAFLDEIFKASSSILNALLTIMNERVYHNGTEAMKVPLRALIAASNELPTGQEELSALYDRFLVRSFVDYINEDKLQHLFELNNVTDIINPLTQEDLNALDELIANVSIPNEIKEAVLDIWRKHKDTFKEDRREVLSDRRLIKVIKLLRVSAATNGRNEANLSDVLLLKDCLWSHPDNACQVCEIVLSTLPKYSHAVEVDKKNQALVNTIRKEPVIQKSSKNTIKGYAGSGTKNDPLLISNVNELFGLNRQDIGAKEFYFRQTKDIDLSTLSSWNPISFTGHYNGNNFSIHGSDCCKTLFSKSNPKSSVSHLQLINLSLTTKAEGTYIHHCKVDGHIVCEEAIGCTIHDCTVNKSLVGVADDCTIDRCETSSILVSGYENGTVDVESYIKNSRITDCLMQCDYDDYARFGIANVINENSKITRCLVTGSNDVLEGLAGVLNNSEICYSALGHFDSGHIYSAITPLSSTATLRNNASIDSLVILGREDNFNGKDGKKVAAAQFNQYFFEHTLEWDFNEVWLWNKDTNLPILRKVEIESVMKPAHGNEGDEYIHLLALQIKVNIWL